jgi:hypothetical protein
MESFHVDRIAPTIRTVVILIESNDIFLSIGTTACPTDTVLTHHVCLLYRHHASLCPTVDDDSFDKYHAGFGFVLRHYTRHVRHHRRSRP